MFEKIQKYYTLSKKYAPLCLMIVFFGLLLARFDTAIVLGVYLGLMLLHLVVLALIKRYVKLHIAKCISAEDMQEIENVLNADVHLHNDEVAENENDTKESD